MTEQGKAAADDHKQTDKLPGNHGQFGSNEAMEDYKTLENQPAADAPADKGPKQTNAGERS